MLWVLVCIVFLQFYLYTSTRYLSFIVSPNRVYYSFICPIRSFIGVCLLWVYSFFRVSFGPMKLTRHVLCQYLGPRLQQRHVRLWQGPAIGFGRLLSSGLSAAASFATSSRGASLDQHKQLDKTCPNTQTAWQSVPDLKRLSTRLPRACSLHLGALRNALCSRGSLLAHAVRH